MKRLHGRVVLKVLNMHSLPDVDNSAPANIHYAQMMGRVVSSSRLVDCSIKGTCLFWWRIFCRVLHGVCCTRHCGRVLDPSRLSRTVHCCTAVCEYFCIHRHSQTLSDSCRPVGGITD